MQWAALKVQTKISEFTHIHFISRNIKKDYKLDATTSSMEKKFILQILLYMLGLLKVLSSHHSQSNNCTFKTGKTLLFSFLLFALKEAESLWLDSQKSPWSQENFSLLGERFKQLETGL